MQRTRNGPDEHGFAMIMTVLIIMIGALLAAIILTQGSTHGSAQCPRRQLEPGVADGRRRRRACDCPAAGRQRRRARTVHGSHGRRRLRRDRDVSREAPIPDRQRRLGRFGARSGIRANGARHPRSAQVVQVRTVLVEQRRHEEQRHRERRHMGQRRSHGRSERRRQRLGDLGDQVRHHAQRLARSQAMCRPAVTTPPATRWRAA